MMEIHMNTIDLFKEVNEKANDQIEAILEWFNESVKLIDEQEEKEKKFGKPLTELFGQGRPPIGGLSKASQVAKVSSDPEDIGQGAARTGEREMGITPFGPRQAQLAGELGAGDVEGELAVGARAVVDHGGERYPAVVTFAEDGIYQFKPAIPGKGQQVSVQAADMHYNRLPNGNFAVKILK